MFPLFHRFWLLSSFPLLGLVLPWATLAQIAGDRTVNTLVNGSLNAPCAAGICQITGGTQASTNLFHSFSQFSIPTGGSAVFNNALTIQNIITRVTGSSLSSIDGLIRANGTANLFLINPNGIILGANASLNIGGSFIASTASSIVFADGTQFSASSPVTPMLTVSVPVGLQFGSNPGAIQVNQATLRVSDGRTLALVGGDVSIAESTLRSPAGRIELGSVDSNQAVTLQAAGNGLALTYPAAQAFRDIQISQNSLLTTSSTNGNGSVQIQSRRLTMTGGSAVLTPTATGSQPGGSLIVNAIESVDLSGISRGIPTGFFANANGTGTPPNLTINTPQLTVRDSAAIRAQTVGAGSGGNLTLNVNQLVVEGAQISVSTFGSGDAGTLTVNAAEQVFLSGNVPEVTGLAAGLFGQSNGATATRAAATGAGGGVQVNTPKLIVRDGARVSVNSEGTGVAGNLTVNAPFILLDNQGGLTATTLGGQGNIFLNSQDLRLRRNSLISTNARGPATGGNIQINTDTLVALENSDITANAEDSFGGRVTISAQAIFGTQFRLQQTPESDITATSRLGPLFSGQVTIQTPDIDPSRGLLQLQTTVVDPSRLVVQTCGTNAPKAGGEFIITGRGGLPASPQDSLSDETVLVDLGSSLPDRGSHGTVGSPAIVVRPDDTAIPVRSLAQAQGWVVNGDGKVVLLAQSPNSMVSPNSWLFSPPCHAR